MKRFTHLVALVTSFALVTCANAAIGSTRPDDRATHGPSAITLVQPTDVVRPDDRATHGPSAITLAQPTDVVRPDDRASRPSTITLEQVPVIAPGGSGPVHADGFDWLDAGIGAAAALGLGLIVGGVAFVLRRAQTPAYP